MNAGLDRGARVSNRYVIDRGVARGANAIVCVASDHTVARSRVEHGGRAPALRDD